MSRIDRERNATLEATPMRSFDTNSTSLCPDYGEFAWK